MVNLDYHNLYLKEISARMKAERQLSELDQKYSTLVGFIASGTGAVTFEELRKYLKR